MRLTSTALLATAAAALAWPAAGQERDVACDTEVAAFLETLRADATFPLIEAAFANLEADLVEAVESDEGTCFAILAEVQTAMLEEGYVVEGASDRQSVDRTRAIARRFRAAGRERAGDLATGGSPTAVGVETEAPDVSVDPGETEVAVRQPEPEVTVRQSTPDVTVRQEEAEVTVVGPDEEVRVVEEDGGQRGPASPPTDVEVSGEPRRGPPREREPGMVARADAAAERLEGHAGEPVDGPPREEEEAGIAAREDAAAAVTERMEGRLEEEIAERTRSVGRRAAGTAARGDEVAARELPADLDVEAVAAFEAFAVREVEFAFDSATVPLEEVAAVLDEVASLVEEEPDSAVLLTGYASPIGSRAYNRQLSEARVEAVRDALVDLGVPQPLIRTRSLGERNTEVPAGENERSPANRRVEIRVLDLSGMAG